MAAQTKFFFFSSAGVNANIVIIIVNVLGVNGPYE